MDATRDRRKPVALTTLSPARQGWTFINELFMNFSQRVSPQPKRHARINGFVELHRGLVSS
jgi:hypothetical protein